jgi:tRNA U55 pseudouridine synthase TruB
MIRDMEKYVVLEKVVGETPLSCAEAYRAKHPKLAGVPMAYAGRLDPMASGKLLILLGDGCKVQEKYHGLDKEYEFSVLFGIGSDTHDVLGRLQTCNIEASPISLSERVRLGRAARSALEESEIGDASLIKNIAKDLVGPIELPYPHFSAKTVQNKPLHMWTLEGRLNEIEIPTNRSTIYELELTKIETKSREEIATEARAKIDTIPPVTDLRKALGNDFRRVDVRKDWAEISGGNFGPVSLPDSYTIAHFRCVASSGTYMRSLAHLIGKRLGTCGLAWHIHRTKIGAFNPANLSWDQEY